LSKESILEAVSIRLKMDQKVIIDSIEKHLYPLEAVVSWIIVIAITAAWAGVQREIKNGTNQKYAKMTYIKEAENGKQKFRNEKGIVVGRSI